MSAEVHYSDAADGVIPKRFLCRRKCKDGSEWTKSVWIVDCPRCLEILRKDEPSISAQRGKE